MATQYVCSNCGFHSPTHYGKCPDCGEWNSMARFVEAKVTGEAKHATPATFQKLADAKEGKTSRIRAGIGEVDRVLGGGYVPGQVIMLAGEPGIGKSTLVLSLATRLSSIYVSGEESPIQVKQRAIRMKLDPASISFTSEGNIGSVIAGIKQLTQMPEMLIIDSIQTVYSPNIEASLGTQLQTKEVTNQLVEFAKATGVVVIIIGHVTKSGEIAGPKTLEHLVDTVFFFEGERNGYFRILKSLKNRFGPVDEVGIFEMTELGLTEAKDPSLFVEDPSSKIGKSIVGVIEGSRPLFFEIQALVVPTTLPVPRRVIAGYDYNKALLLLAVMRKQLGINVDTYDVYITVVGGIKLKSTSTDLGLCAALYSSIKNIAVPPESVFCGEVDLLGDIRPVMHLKKIESEAKRFGFNHVYSKSLMKSIRDIKKIF